MDSPAMIDYIKNFRLDSCRHGNQGYSRVLLQLFGLTGHGKSSFINSCKYVVDDGPFKVYAQVAESEKKPETMIRHSYELTETITLVDNRGCVKMNKYEIGAVYAQLGNFQPLDNEVKWQNKYMDMVETLLNSDRRDQSSDFIVPVFIYSADCPLTNCNDIKEMLMAARDITGVFPTLVLTHELSQHLQRVKESFRQMGVKNMFSLENYTKEDSMKTRGKQETILKCLQEIIKDVEFRMLEERDVIGEKIERLKILLKFAHERGLEEQQKEMQKQREKERRTCAVL